jgi:hypothetical protein
MVGSSVFKSPPPDRVAEANEALKAAQRLPPGPKQIDAPISARVLRNRAVLTELVDRRVK